MTSANWSRLVHRSVKFLSDNSPMVLTVVGVTGTITTAVLTGKASFKAAQILQEEKVERNLLDKEPLTKKEMVLVTWKEYIPAVGTGVITIAAIIGVNRIGTRRAAAMAAAYSLSEKAFTEYREKVVEKLGEKKELALRDEIAQDQVTKNPVSEREVIITGCGDYLCYDSISGRYFRSDIELLRKAENDINHKIIHEMYATLYDFYKLIGLSPTLYSTEVGWNLDDMLVLNFSTVLSEDGKPCLSVNYKSYPVRSHF